MNALDPAMPLSEPDPRGFELEADAEDGKEEEAFNSQDYEEFDS